MKAPLVIFSEDVSTVPFASGNPRDGAPEAPFQVMVSVALEDVDKDGDADVVLYVAGVQVYSIQASTLLGNVRAEFKRVAKRVRKAVKKHKHQKG